MNCGVLRTEFLEEHAENGGDLGDEEEDACDYGGLSR
jgi:hypothetical protein